MSPRYPQKSKRRTRNKDENNGRRNTLICRMPRNQRYVLPGYAYNVTQRGTDRQNVFRQAGRPGRLPGPAARPTARRRRELADLLFNEQSRSPDRHARSRRLVGRLVSAGPRAVCAVFQREATVAADTSGKAVSSPARYRRTIWKSRYGMSNSIPCGRVWC